MFADSASTPLRVLVLWMHVTHSDRMPPNSLVLARIPDRRAIQWWDPNRVLSKTMLHDYSPDTAMTMADTTGGTPPVIWDFVAMWRRGARWTDRLPPPDFFGHPVFEWIEPFRRRLGELARAGTGAK